MPNTAHTAQEFDKNSPSNILDLAYQRASTHISTSLIADAAIASYVEYVCRNTGSRIAVRLLITCLLAKIHNPTVDVRKPFTKIGGADSFSGRAYDEHYVREFVLRHELPCGGMSVFLMPALHRQRDSPLTIDINWVGRTSQVYRTIVELLDVVYKDYVLIEDLLAETIRWLLIERNERREAERNTPHGLTQIAMSQLTRPLRVFLCHASEDKAAVRVLYRRLKALGIDPWLDEEDLVAGQDWEFQIRKAVRDADIVLACLSERGVGKTGFVQREIKLALDVAEEQPEGAIFIVPLKLNECVVPERLRQWHWVDYFEERGHENLLRALRERASTLEQVALPSDAESQNRETTAVQQVGTHTNETTETVAAEAPPARKALLARAASITSRQRFKDRRNAWLTSEKGKHEAAQEYRKFIDELHQLVNAIADANPDMQFVFEDDGDGFRIIYSSGISLTASWNPGRFANSLEGSGLHLKVFKGRVSTRPVINFAEPEVVEHKRYDVDLHENAGIVWYETEGDRRKFPTSSELAELWMRIMLEKIERHGESINL